ncbi:VOC family protein [Novosphingobium sp. ZN18A2]|uniref:VOC family protein n=1 Tax=Novosphingobium sp. ZN18A2 TaxID=3079861 RepID=UPI0030CFAE42
MTKIAVRDLEAQEAFYEKVASFAVTKRVELPGFRESIMIPVQGGGGALVLMHEEGSEPLPGSTLLVFETEDIHAFAERLAAAGGSITRPIERVEGLGLSFAFFIDPEGNTQEVVEHH